jgi:hypothetical protein
VGFSPDHEHDWREAARGERGTELGHILHTRLPTAFPDVASDDRLAAVRDILASAGLCRAVVAPLLVGEEIWAWSRRTPRLRGFRRRRRLLTHRRAGGAGD